MLIRSSLLLAAAALLSSAGYAKETAAPADGTEQAAPAKEKKICRSMRITGSRMPVRTCKTEREWADAAANKDSTQLQVLSKGSLTAGAASSVPN